MANDTHARVILFNFKKFYNGRGKDEWYTCSCNIIPVEGGDYMYKLYMNDTHARVILFPF